MGQNRFTPNRPGSLPHYFFMQLGGLPNKRLEKLDCRIFMISAEVLSTSLTVVRVNITIQYIFVYILVLGRELIYLNDKNGCNTFIAKLNFVFVP